MDSNICPTCEGPKHLAGTFCWVCWDKANPDNQSTVEERLACPDPPPSVAQQMADQVVREMIQDDAINPTHYTEHPSGVDAITITRHMNFNLGNAFKYIWRAGLKGKAIQDLEKAKWYLEDEIKRIKDPS